MKATLVKLWWAFERARWRFKSWIWLRISSGRTIHGIRVRLAPSFDHAAKTRALAKVESALDLIARYDPRRMTRLARDLRWIWIQRSGYAVGWYQHALRMCVLDREYLAAPDQSAAVIAAILVHEGTHARLHGRNIRYPEPARARIEAFCDAQSIAFLRRLPDGEAWVPGFSQDRVTESDRWSNARLDRDWSDGIRVERDAMERDIDAAALPLWLKRGLMRSLNSSADSPTEPLKAANLAVRFLLELSALGSLGYWGVQQGGSVVLKVALGILLPFAMAVFWGLFVAPKALFGRSRVRRLALGLLVFGVAAVALVSAGHRALGWTFLAVALVNTVLTYAWGPQPGETSPTA